MEYENDVMHNFEVKEDKHKVFRKRWLILLLFSCLSASNAFQWIEYSVINDKICAFYAVSSSAVNWTSMVYMLCYIPLILPATWLLDRFGTRWTVTLGALVNFLGAAIKCFTADSGMFALSLVGQTIAGASQIFILGVPPRLAAVWFGGSEVSTACALGVFGNQLGIAAGFLLPPVIVSTDLTVNGTIATPEDVQTIGAQLFSLFLWSAGANAAILVLVSLFFADKPPVPPSLAQMSVINSGLEVDYAKSLRALMTNKNFVLLVITYGINVGVFYAVSTLLNQIVLRTHPGENVNVGRIGLVIILAGVAGSAVSGLWLDYSHTFKGTTVIIYVFSLLGLIAYTVTVQTGPLPLVFISAGFLGFFMTGYLPIGFEFGAELTYPIAEGTQSGLLNASAQLFGIALTQFMGDLLTWTSPLVSNITQCIVLGVGSALTCFIKPDLRRRRANVSGTAIVEQDGDFEMSTDKPVVEGVLLSTSDTNQSLLPPLMQDLCSTHTKRLAPIQSSNECSL